MKRCVCILLALLMLLSTCAALAEGAEGGEDAYTFTFATTDLDGNIVTSAEIYAGNRITMINIWASWCGPCVSELAALAQIHTQLQESGCGIVGILIDSLEAEGVETAQAVMAENGTNYPVLALSEDLYGLMSVIQVVPTTIFVDSNGKLVGNPIFGARTDLYVPTVLALLGETA